MIKAIFRLDPIYQVGEKVRIDVSQSFKTPDEVAYDHVKIKPDTSASFIDVTDVLDQETWFVDWVYATAGVKTVEVEIKAGLNTINETFQIEIKTEASERLFAKDTDLLVFEPDLYKWLPRGRSTWNYVHREVQKRIMFELDKSRIFNNDGSKITLDQVLDITEFREWAKFKALGIIFNSFNNATDDIFREKAKYYESKDFDAMNFSINLLRLDINKDGNATLTDEKDHRSVSYIKR